jgi:hypothetical protein
MEIPTTIDIIQGSCNKIYQIGTVQYDIHFPLHWALDPKQLENDYVCGPSHCNNCLEYGSYHGVFIGYCLNCAYEYGYERGNGFLTYGVECSEGYGREPKNSAWNTYLKNVDLENVGWHSWVDPPFVDDWESDAGEDADAEAEDADETKEEGEKEGCSFREVASETSEEEIEDNSSNSHAHLDVYEKEEDYDDYYGEDYHDYVDSESEHFYVRGVW